jgi:biopolymer transport protein ExbD
MAMNVGGGDGEEDELTSSINTTPLVDVMLVLLIIFLITIPVVTHTIPLHLPKETIQPNQVKPETIVLAVTRDGDVYWDQTQVTDNEDMLNRLRKIAVIDPQPEVHIRGDDDAKYEPIGRILLDCTRVGIAKVAFITQPPPRGG